jgi:DNA-binding GntR family transcriptional regulator
VSLEYQSLREQARRAIRVRIITGDLLPGKLYPIRTLAEDLGVSATPVREALSDLSHSGLVEVSRNRGFTVRELTRRDLSEIVDLRLMLEVPAMRQLSQQFGPDDLELCTELMEKGRDAARQGDLETFLELDRRFHLQLLELLGNSRLVQTVDKLRDETRLFGLRELARSNQLVESADEHEKLLVALAAGDPNVTEIITGHIEHARGIWAGEAEDTTDMSATT